MKYCMEYQVACAACRGTYHIQKELPCQDVTEGRKWANYAAIALADGAGSCEFSQEGARSVVQTVLSTLENNASAWLEVSSAGVEEAMIAACLDELEQSPYEIEKQASTLLFCMANADGDFLCGHLGDGYLFLVRDGQSEILSLPENGENLNETVFVTTPHAAQHLRLQRGKLQSGDAVILCSDGSGEALYAREEQRCAPALAKMAGWLAEYTEEEVMEALEHNLDQVFRNSSFDDMSIAVLYCE